MTLSGAALMSGVMVGVAAERFGFAVFYVASSALALAMPPAARRLAGSRGPA